MTISLNDRVLDLNYIFPALRVRGARPSPNLGPSVFQTIALSVLKVPIVAAAAATKLLFYILIVINCIHAIITKYYVQISYGKSETGTAQFLAILARSNQLKQLKLIEQQQKNKENLNNCKI